MFDAYFSPPFLHPTDAEHMVRFGVTECVLAVPSAHCDRSVEGARALDEDLAHDPHARPIVRQEHTKELLIDAGIRVHVADGISPHLEPERSWEAQWAFLVSRVEQQKVQVLGVIVFDGESERGLRILDRHLALSKAHNLPIFVQFPRQRWSAEGFSALCERASTHGDRWYWARPPLSFAGHALRRGHGVIVSTSRRLSADILIDWFDRLPLDMRARVAMGSSRGRGLNPFALASLEMAADAHGRSHAHQDLLLGGALGGRLRRPVAHAGFLSTSDVAL